MNETKIWHLKSKVKIVDDVVARGSWKVVCQHARSSCFNKIMVNVMTLTSHHQDIPNQTFKAEDLSPLRTSHRRKLNVRSSSCSSNILLQKDFSNSSNPNHPTPFPPNKLPPNPSCPKSNLGRGGEEEEEEEKEKKRTEKKSKRRHFKLKRFIIVKHGFPCRSI